MKSESLQIVEKCDLFEVMLGQTHIDRLTILKMGPTSGLKCPKVNEAYEVCNKNECFLEIFVLRLTVYYAVYAIDSMISRIYPKLTAYCFRFRLEVSYNSQFYNFHLQTSKIIRSQNIKNCMFFLTSQVKKATAFTVGETPLSGQS